jgi:hypothetical protein
MDLSDEWPDARPAIFVCRGRGRMQRFHVAIWMLAIMLTASAAHADELLPLPPDQPAQTQSSGPKETSVHTGRPQCLRWTDGCVSCTRNDIKDKPACSNIGPACQPTEIRCIQSEPSPGTSDGKTP